jgi:hypothetical protein
MARSEACERAYRAYYNRNWDKCLDECHLALNENEEDYEAMHAAAVACLYTGKPGMTFVLLRHALALAPDFQNAWVTLGNANKMAFRYPEAQKAWGKALELKPDDAITCSNMASIFSNNQTPEMAEKWCRRALELDPGMSDAMRNLSFSLFEQEKWKEGWECFEARAVNQAGPITRNYWHRGQTPAWDGTPGKTVVAYGEQGVGDELLYFSILPDLLKVCDKVIVECHPRLVDTVKRSFPQAHAVFGTRKEPIVDWARDFKIDAALGVGSLGKHFRNANEEFPRTPYIVPDAAVVAKHRQGSRKLRVGISWAGGTVETYRNYRSTKLQQWAPILKANAEFYSFQYDKDSATQCAVLEEQTGIHIRHRPGLVECKNYDTTINFAASMDLLISVQGTLFHVGGSLGIPTWCLVSSRPAWRYGMKGEESRWYGSARLFRQEGLEWEPVIARVAKALRDFRVPVCAAAE